MKLKPLYLTGIFFALVLAGCEKDLPTDQNLRDDYLGDWNVNETTGVNAPQFYEVTAVKGSAPDELIFEGLYNFPQTEVLATADGFQLSIAQQSSQGITFSGSGQANADFDQVTLNFVADDGTGKDTVKAVLVRP